MIKTHFIIMKEKFKNRKILTNKTEQGDENGQINE